MLKLDHLLYLNNMLHIFEIFHLSFQRAPDELRQSCVAMKPLDCDSRDLVWFLFEFPNTTGPRLNLGQSSGILGMFLLQDDYGFETHKDLFL